MTGLEAKLRAALQDKNSAQVEKATAERNLKALQGQAGRLTKDLEKKARNLAATGLLCCSCMAATVRRTAVTAGGMVRLSGMIFVQG